LVREANALDATIFNAVFSAPVGATLAWGVFFALSAFPGSDIVWATIISFIINIPVLLMMALLASSMPRTGGDYVWVSRILSPPLALVSNFGAALSATIGATFWARYFPVYALGPILATLGITFDNKTLLDWGNSFQQDTHWVFAGAMVMVVLMGAILIAGLRTTSAGRMPSGSSPRPAHSWPSSCSCSGITPTSSTTSTRSAPSTVARPRRR
jgi:amino acid transporter